MPSSTSSSEDGPTPRARALTWAAALLLAGGALGAYEAALRSRGLRPSVVDDVELWTCVRAEADGADLRTFVLAGSSRIQCAFMPEAAREVVPGLRTVQLAINNTHPVAVVRDLARDASFKGVVLVSLLPGALGRAEWDDQEPWVRRRDRGWTFNDALNRRLRAFLQERLVALAPEAEARRLIESFRRRGTPPPQHVTMRSDRTRDRRPEVTLPEDAAKSRLLRDRGAFASLLRKVKPSDWLADADAFDAFVRAIRARGGRIVVLCDHLSGEYARVFEENYPRAAFWDAFAARSSAVCLRGDDVPEIAAMPCPDGSHIDGPDSPAFTRVLMRELVRRGVFAP